MYITAQTSSRRRRLENVVLMPNPSQAVHFTASTKSVQGNDVATQTGDSLVNRNSIRKQGTTKVHGKMLPVEEDLEASNDMLSTSDEGGGSEPTTPGLVVSRGNSGRSSLGRAQPTLTTDSGGIEPQVEDSSIESTATKSEVGVGMSGKASKGEKTFSAPHRPKRRLGTTPMDKYQSTPASKRRRSSRSHPVDVLSYDLSHHPMDAYTRPQAVAKKKLKAHANIFQFDSNSTANDDEEFNSPVKTLLPEMSDNVALESRQGGKVAFKARNRTLSVSSDALEGERRRSGRTSSNGNSPNYDCSWHPADDVLRPQAVAWRNRKIQRQGDLVGKDYSSIAVDNSNKKQAIFEPRIGEGENNWDSGRRDPLPSINATFSGQPTVEREEDKSLPPQRRSSRTKRHDNTFIYNTRFHPADVTLRPASAAKHTPFCLPMISTPASIKKFQEEIPKKKAFDAPKGTSSNRWGAPATSLHDKLLGTPPNMIKVEDFRKMSNSPNSRALTPPKWSQLQNPYTPTRALDWEKLQDIDRFIYVLQKGAPANSKTLPMKWQTLKDRLHEEGHITLDESRSNETTDWLRARYESVRLGVQAFFKAKSEAIDKRDWIVFYAEGLDVFEMECGRKYWRHFEESIVKPTSTRFSDLKHRDTPCSGFPRCDIAEPDFKDKEGLDNPPLESIGERGLHGLTHSETESSQAMSTIDPANLERTVTNASRYASPWAGTTWQGVAYDDLDPFGVWLEDQCEAVRSEYAGQLPHEKDPILLSVPVRNETSTDKGSLVEELPNTSCHGYGLDNIPSTERTSIDIDVNGLVEVAVENGEKQRHADCSSHLNEAGTKPAAAFLQEASSITPRKRKGRPKESDFIHIHEDQPGDTPRINRIVARNLVSPGTDIPKENLSSQERLERYVENSVTATPESGQRRLSSSTPRVARTLYDGRVGPYRSVFGR